MQEDILEAEATPANDVPEPVVVLDDGTEVYAAEPTSGRFLRHPLVADLFHEGNDDGDEGTSQKFNFENGFSANDNSAGLRYLESPLPSTPREIRAQIQLEIEQIELFREILAVQAKLKGRGNPGIDGNFEHNGHVLNIWDERIRVSEERLSALIDALNAL